MAKPLREITRFIWWMQTQRRGGRQPSDQANRLGLRVRQKEMAAIVHIHHRHLLLLIPRADTHFTVPQRVEGWVDLIIMKTTPRVGPGYPFLPLLLAVHSLPHLLLFFSFSLFSFALPFIHPFPFYQNSHHSISRPEIVGGDRTWV